MENPAALTPASCQPTESAPYVELHLHSNYSLLNGASHPEELVARAATLGYSALALTDQNNLYAAVAWGHICKEHGIRPITGMELTMLPSNGPVRNGVTPFTHQLPNPGYRMAGQGKPAPHTPIKFHSSPAAFAPYRLTLLASNRTGYANLCRLASLSHGHSGSLVADPTRRNSPHISLPELMPYTEGLICMAGCRDSEISSLLSMGMKESARSHLRKLQQLFNAGNLYLELNDNLVEGDRKRNLLVISLAEATGIPIVATGDVYYHDRSRYQVQDVLISIDNGITLAESSPFRKPNDEFFLRSPGDQARRFHNFATAIENTLKVAQQCQFDITRDLGYKLPHPDLAPEATTTTALVQLCNERLSMKYEEHERKAAQERLDEELRLVQRHDLSGFFLIYHEILKLAKQVAMEIRPRRPEMSGGISPGRGRGSSVGSIICYLIGLSHIDPVRNNLFLGRFLNEEMVSLPDIDLDFPRDIRAALFEAIFQKWGSHHAAIICTFQTYRIKSAIRDVGKALGLRDSDLSRLANTAEGHGSPHAMRKEMERLPGFLDGPTSQLWERFADIVEQVSDFPRHISQHVGGVVISSDPLIDCVPIEPSAYPKRYLAQWDKDSIEQARMVKIDVLGLGMLSAVDECIDSLASKGVPVDLSRINFADQQVYDRISRGDTIGVFQIESRAQASILPRSRPRNLNDLAAQVAIIRPGPIAGGAVHRYLEGRERQRRDPQATLSLPHESLREPLEETLGVILYQEQVLQVAIAMGRFGTGEAESFRRAMGRRDWPRARDRYLHRFLQGAGKLGVTETVARETFLEMEGFAEFGFPKSHATAFALLAYQSAWLREYYPAEFFCALFNQWPMGFYPPHVLSNEARRLGISVLRPDINTSMDTCTSMDMSIQLGLLYVDHIGKYSACEIVAERQRAGRYESLFEFVHRTRLPYATVSALIVAGTFGGFGLNHRELLWQLGLLEYGDSHTGSQSTLRLPIEQDCLHFEDSDPVQKVADDYSSIGLSPDTHPVRLFRTSTDPKPSSSLRGKHPGERVKALGLVVCRQRPPAARGAAFITMEDEDGLINVTVPTGLYEKKRDMLRSEGFLLLQGIITGHAGNVPLLKATGIIGVKTAFRHAIRNWG